MRPTRRHLIAALAAATIVASLAVPAMAKEFLQATLDAPIALGTPPGTEIIVGVTVDDGAGGPVVGSPIRLILTGRYGDVTYAAGAALDDTPGHYIMRITIPAGGVRQAVVAMHGTSDLPIMLTADPFTFGPVSARSAQAAPPLAPGITPLPRGSAPVAAVDPAQASAPAPVPVAQPAASQPAPVTAPAGPAPLALAGLAGAALLLVGALALVARSRNPRRPAASGRLPGA